MNTRISPEFYLKIQSVPRSKHTASGLQKSFREMLPVCFEIPYKTQSTLSKRNGELFQCQISFYIETNWALTFKNRASYIQDGRTATLQMLHFIYFFSTIISTEYFKHAAHSPFFSSKCRLFHNATFFGSCIIHILHTGCAKI